MLDSAGERLVAVRQNLRQTQAQFSAALGVSKRTLQGYESGRSLPGGDTLLGLYRLGFNPNWILTGIGEMHLGAADQSPSMPGTALLDGIVMVERLAFSASAGNGALVLDELGASFPVRRELLLRLGLRPEHARMVEAVGTSMVPTIQDRDVLLVDASPDARQMIREGEIYLFTIDHEAYIKRLRRDLGQWIMIADNQELFPPRPIPRGEHVEIVGRVCWGAREL